jgi:hypothetical protein
VAAGVVDRVEPDVRFCEPAEVRQLEPGSQRRAGNLERNQPDVRHSVDEHIGAGAVRVQVRNALRVHRPVDEREVGPKLVEQHRSPKRR